MIGSPGSLSCAAFINLNASEYNSLRCTIESIYSNCAIPKEKKVLPDGDGGTGDGQPRDRRRCEILKSGCCSRFVKKGCAGGARMGDRSGPVFRSPSAQHADIETPPKDAKCPPNFTRLISAFDRSGRARPAAFAKSPLDALSRFQSASVLM
jgi:hypothetical protein